MTRSPRPAPLLAALALAASAASTAQAGPGKVLVLPLDGDAPADVRAKYSTAVQRLARTLDGKVSTGDVTFTDTATAVGCDPKAPACAEDVRATLGVDELVYGTVRKEDGGLVLVVRRVGKGKPRREVTATLQASDAPGRAEPQLLPLFREPGEVSTPEPPPVTEAPPPAEEPPPAEPPPETPSAPPQDTPRSHTRVLGYAALGGAGTLLLISFALWSSASGLEDEISGHRVSDREDFDDLRDLEDRASARAWTGNAMFAAALVAGGVGGWLLYRDRKARHGVIAPAPAPGGAALVWGGVF